MGGVPLPPGSDGPRGDAGTDKLSTQNHCPKLKSKQYHDKTVNFLPEIDPILFPKNICQSGRERKKRKFVPAFFQFVYGFGSMKGGRVEKTFVGSVPLIL